MSTTTWVIQLRYGAAAITLSSGLYRVGLDFVPPDVLIAPVIAEGTSANRMGGGTKVGESGRDAPWSFTLKIQDPNGSEAELRNAADKVRQLLALAGDQTTPVYLYYKPNSDTSLDPLWGQAGYYYEILQGGLTLGDLYATGDARSRGLLNCVVSLTIKPYARGVPQRLARATGGILPDQWGTADGTERGLMIPEACTTNGGNKMTNPVFGATAPSAWNTGWTAGGVIASQNTNPNFLLPQTLNSAFLQGQAATFTFTQNINVGNTNWHAFSAYVMRPDGAPVTAADVKIWYGGQQASSYINLGDGLWLVTANVLGVASLTTTGVYVPQGASIYLLGFQCEEKLWWTPLCWGDLMGCAWTGAAHGSTSTRTLAAVSLPIDDTILRADQGSVVIAWAAPYPSSILSNGLYCLFDSRDGTNKSLCLFYDRTNARWSLQTNNGAVQANGAATFAAGSVNVLHTTWGPASGLTLYLNGVQIGNTALTIVALGARLCLGAINTGGSNINGTFLDCRTYAYELSAAEVANDYNNTNDVSGASLAAAQRVGAIPWLWTNNGDDVVGAVDGNVSAVRKYNWAVSGGIPGSAAARVEAKLTHTQGLNTFGAIWIGRWRLPVFLLPTNLDYADYSGTADVGSSSGDAYLTPLFTDTSGNPQVVLSLSGASMQWFQNTEVAMFVRLKDAGANLTLAFCYNFGGGGNSFSDYAAAAADGTMRVFKTPAFIIPRLYGTFLENLEATVLSMGFNPKRTTGSGNLGVDFMVMLPSPLTRLYFSSTDTDTVILVRDRDLKATGAFGIVRGDLLELEPGLYNVLVHVLRDVGQPYVVTDTLTYTAVFITPRYALL